MLAPNGVDDEFFDVDGPGDEDRVLFFGHFGYEANRRGIERFLAEGWPEVRRARPNARLALAGGGMERRARFAATASTSSGSSPTCPRSSATARAVVVPIWEGGGTRLKVLEALAAGRAVVSTPLGASGIGFEHGRHGLLAEIARRARDRTRPACWPIRCKPRPWVETAGFWLNDYRWKEALSGASAFYSEVMARARFARLTHVQRRRRPMM